MVLSRVWINTAFHTLLVWLWIGSTTLKYYLVYLLKLTIQIPVAFMVLNPREMHTYVHQEMYSKLFLVALFILAPKQKLLKCLSAIKWISEMWHICSKAYHAAIRMNKLQLHTTVRMNLINKIFSERSQTQVYIHTMWFYL